MNWDTLIIFEAILGVCCLLGIILIFFRASNTEKKAKKELMERQQAEERERVYWEFPANRSEILSEYRQRFEGYVADEVKRSFSIQGKSTMTQKGDYRVDYTKAVQKLKNEMIADGASEENALLYVQEHFPHIMRRDLAGAVNAFFQNIRRERSNQSRTDLSDGISPELFLKSMKNQSGDMVGVYIIYNQTKNMYYVGQAKRLFFRVRQHFTGHGNGDVYADYKYGDSFLIRLITLRESGYDDLDRLERDMIARYNAYSSGYNKTAGNQ